MKENINIIITGSGIGDLLKGSIPVDLTVVNNSSESIEILLPYPNPNNLFFNTDSGAVHKKDIEPDLIERIIPTILPPNKEIQKKYFLNRYLFFTEIGKYKINYYLELPVSMAIASGDKHATLILKGSFEITLIDEVKSTLRMQFEQYAEKLGSADNQTKIEAAEALAYLDTNLAIPYLSRMLSIEDLEKIGIQALSRHPSQEVFDRITEMLDHQESGVVDSALTELTRNNIILPREKIQSLLNSINASIRLIGINWLVSNPDCKLDKKLVKPLLNDTNEIVKSTAEKYMKSSCMQ